MIGPYRFLLIMDLSFSHSVLTRNILYYKNTPPQERTTPIHTGGGTIESHFWIELPLKLDNQTIQIKVLVCNSQCLHDFLLGKTSLAHLSTWQDYANNKLYIQQISIPIVAKNNVRILLGNTRIILAALKTGKTTFTPRNTIMGKGIAYV